jgi:4-methylaminobutanoate oxidase (formaldehyde-forming)
MSSQLPDRARVVIVGGGIVGVSVAYGLTKRGWNDVVLLERRKLTSGTTWHAAGLVTELRATTNLTRLVLDGLEIFENLEAETGLATGFRTIGQITIACNEPRLEEIKRQASMARGIGVRVELLSTDECVERFPLLDPAEVLGGMYFPDDAVVNPTDSTLALAKGARMGGARIFEDTKVTAVLERDGRVAGVSTDRGDIEAEVVVNCTGMWGREFGELSHVGLPLQAMEHFYIVTEPIPDLPSELPVLKSFDDWCYVKLEAGGKLLVGFFEPGGAPWALDGIPDDVEFLKLPDNWDHLTPFIQQVAKRVPVLQSAGIQLFFNGPESFTPDARFYFGDVPELRNYFVACGFNSVGLLTGPGAGKALADWIVDGHPPMDLWDVDVRRMMPFQSGKAYLAERIPETLGILYDMHWPFRQFESARGVRRSPVHDRLAARGACFGELAGWERPNWYAPPGVEPRYEYSHGRQNWFPYSAEEHRAAREAVALFDHTAFTQFLVQGRDAEAALQRMCVADVAVPVGRIVYTQMLNDRAGIEADLTVTRLAEDRFLVIGAAAEQTKDGDWLRTHIPDDARAFATDVSSAYAFLAVMGPRSRALLSTLTTADLSTPAFPYRESREIDLGYALVRASRITYVGELGWELYMPTEFALHVYDRVVEAGEAFGLRHAGYHALNSLRLEKGYRLWGSDMGIWETPLEAGVAFTVAWDKPGGFIGRDALLRRRDEGIGRRLVQLVLEDPEPLVYRAEPIWRDGTMVGTVTTGMFGHTVGRAVALGYVGRSDGPVTPEWIEAGSYEIEVAWERMPARVHLRPVYDPEGLRVRA